MSKENQIEEIKDHIDSIYGCDCAYYGVDGIGIATVLYEAGYRKQSEGKLIIENHGDGHCFGFCGNCGARYEASNASVLILQYRYCNYCGAKMKGV